MTSSESTGTQFKHTCLNCCVRFADADHWRQHYKSDWHRYNLKRSVAELPPVTAEEFQKRILQQRELAAGPQKDAQYCKHCRKQFGTVKAHANHLQSQRHRDNVERFEVDLVVGEQLAEQEAELDQLNGEREAALQALRDRPAIDPEDENIADDDEGADSDWDDVDSVHDDEAGDEAPGRRLPRYADEHDDTSFENPVLRNKCMFCGERAKSLVDNLRHMSMEHSFFVPDAEYVVDLPGLMRYLGAKVARDFMCLWCNDRGRTFFTLDAARKHMRDKGHCKMLHEGLALAEYADFYDYSSSYPDNSDDMDIDAEIEPEQLEGDEYQLVLPSGAVIGHRSLMRYYKQRLNPARGLVAVSKSNKRLHRVLAEYRSLGWTQTQQAAAAQKARDIHHMKRTYQRWNMKLGVKANKLQRHFRQQVDF